MSVIVEALIYRHPKQFISVTNLSVRHFIVTTVFKVHCEFMNIINLKIAIQSCQLLIWVLVHVVRLVSIWGKRQTL